MSYKLEVVFEMRVFGGRMQEKSNNPIKKEWMWVNGVYCALLACTLFASNSLFAQAASLGAVRSDGQTIETMQEIKDTKGKGWQLKTKGGLTFINPQDESYWVGINGTLRLDEVLYSGSYLDRGNQFPASSARIRRADFNIEGGIGENWEYGVDVLFFGPISRGRTSGRFINALFAGASLEDAFVGYIGIWGKNSELFFGHLSGNWFGLEGSTSSSWMPFLERGAQSFAFYPGDGLGFMFDKWWDDAAITLIALGPDQRQRIFTPFDINSTPFFRNYRSDVWHYVGRFTYAPIHCLGDVWHFGISDAYRDNNASIYGAPVFDFEISAPAGGAVPRNLGPVFSLLNTGNLRVSHSNQWAVEIGRQMGPLIVEGEYQEIHVHRVGDSQGSLRFKGWEIYALYTLTGEMHVYDVRDGNFGKITINDPCIGAWELAARYDYLNLTDKNIHGGSQHNVTLGVNWYINENVRTSLNYIRCNLHPAAGTLPAVEQRKLDVFSFRVQVKFK